MNVLTNVSLGQMTTMKIGGNTHFFAEAATPTDVVTLYKNAVRLQQPVFIIGGGSNTIVRDEGFAGLTIKIAIPGFEVIADDVASTTIKVGAGESWDGFVARTVDMNLSGVSAMSAIPGTVGASPVQNVGAYGQEVADTFVSCTAYDTQSDETIQLTWDYCQFSYRDSIFKNDQKGRYIILDVTFKLYKSAPTPPFYAERQSYFDRKHITEYTPRLIRDATIDIRTDKLPDPLVYPNAGSFFKNAIVENWVYNDLKQTYDDMPAYQMDDAHYKIPTGWLIENAGFKGKVIDGIKVHDKKALVLINQSAKSYQDLASAKQTIIDGVRDKFQVAIEQEPLEVG